jgi:hypothetical protein
MPTPLLIAVPLVAADDVDDVDDVDDAELLHASRSPASEARAATPALLFSRMRRLRLPSLELPPAADDAFMCISYYSGIKCYIVGGLNHRLSMS